MTRLRPFDHLVLAAHDLAVQADFYARLGFHVGARNRHPWGTQNHIVQLHGAFLELICLGEGFAPPDFNSETTPFAGFLSNYLSHGQGLAVLALRSQDAGADARAFAQARIAAGRMRFSREARRPGGEAAEVGFELAFARTPLMSRLRPENFWSPELQRHANGARHVESVLMVAENPADHAEFLGHFTGQREMAANSAGLDVKLAGGRIEALTPLAWTYRTGLPPPSMDAGPRLAGFCISVTDLARAQACLDAGGVPYAHHRSALVIAPEAGYGAAILFEPNLA